MAVRVDKRGRVQMKKPVDKKKTVKSKPPVCNWLDSHKWATKMEIRRLFSGKPDLIIEANAKTSS
jgi:hypothetical protein